MLVITSLAVVTQVDILNQFMQAYKQYSNHFSNAHGISLLWDITNYIKHNGETENLS